PAELPAQFCCRGLSRLFDRAASRRRGNQQACSGALHSHSKGNSPSFAGPCKRRSGRWRGEQRAHVPRLEKGDRAGRVAPLCGGGHGFGVRRSNLPCSTWPERCVDWLQQLGMLRDTSAFLPKPAASGEAWTAVAPREEIRPDFERTGVGGRSERGMLT